MPSGQSLAHQQEQLLCRLAEGNRFQSSSSMLWACESRAQWALEGTQADVLCISCKAALLLNNSLPGSLAHPVHSSLFQSLPPWGLWQAASHCLLPRRALLCRARASVNATLCGFFHDRIEARLSAEFRGMPVEHLVFIAESRYLHGRDLPCRGETSSPGHSPYRRYPSEAPAQLSIGGQSGDITQKDRSSHECLCHGRCRLGC